MPQISQQKIVLQARTWLGTKYHHQGRLKKSKAGAGGVAGFVLGGPSGAILGANLGGMAAGAFFPKSQRVQLPTQEGPRLADLRAQICTYGNIIPRV